MKQGKLYKVSTDVGHLRFCPIINAKIAHDLYWDTWIRVHDGDALMCLGPLDLSTETANDPPKAMQMDTSRRGASCTATAVLAADHTKNYFTYDLARIEMEVEKSLLGHRFLAPNGQLIWIGEYDAKEIFK